MSIILERETEDGWPEYGATFKSGLRLVVIMFEGISVVIVTILAVVLLIFGITRIVGWISALYERGYDRKQAKRRSDEEVMMGAIASGGNEQVVEYGVMATGDAVEEVHERKE